MITVALRFFANCLNRSRDAIRSTRLRVIDRLPVAFADQECRGWESAHLSGVVAVVMTDGDVLDLLELDAELREEIREARLRRGRRVPRWITRVPHEIVVPVSHEVATERQLDLEPVVGVGVRESQADIGRRAVGCLLY